MRVLLIVYDNDSYTNYMPLSLAYICAALEKESYEVDIYQQDIYHYPDEHLTEHLNNNNYDVVGLSVIAGYYQYRKMLKISEAINKAKNRPFYILGGHGPAPEPEYFLRITKADAAVIGEGEETIIDLLDTLKEKKPLKDVLGIAYWDDGKVVTTPRRPLLKDLDDIRPAYHRFMMKNYRLLRMPNCAPTDFTMSVESGRGCSFRCTFCFRLDKGFRPRSPEAIVEDIKYLKSDYQITYINFMDELMMVSEKRVFELCEEIINAKLNVKWRCNGRLNYAKPDVLAIMKKAGCVFINYGIEAYDDEVLKGMKKGLRCSQIDQGIEATLASGMSPGLNFLFGCYGDNRETLQKAVDFLLKYDDFAQKRTIRPVTPYPGTPLYFDAINNGLLKDCEDFYENKHVNSDLLAVNFTEMSDEEFHRALYEANTTLLQSYHRHMLKRDLEMTKKLYLDMDPNFRGYRQI